jgi:hypothetical protein
MPRRPAKDTEHEGHEGETIFSNSLFDPTVKGIKLIGRYGANAQHTLFFIVEADDVDAIHRFLRPGFKRCTSTITPVSEVPVPKD